MAADMVTLRRVDRTYRVFGLGQRAEEVSGSLLALDEAIVQRHRVATEALAEWRGRHALTFAQQAQEVLWQMTVLKSMLLQARNHLESFPERGALPPWLDPPPVAEPPGAGALASAVPAKLRAFVAASEIQDSQLNRWADSVSLEGVTCEVTVELPIPDAQQALLVDRGMDPAEAAGLRREETDRMGRGELERMIDLPDCGPQAAQIRLQSQACCQHTLQTVAAFEGADRPAVASLSSLLPGSVVGVVASWLQGRRPAGDATAEARRLADQLDQLLRTGNLAELETWIEAVAAASSDADLALALLEQVGIERLTEAVGLLWDSYHTDARDPLSPEALAGVMALSELLTTALQAAWPPTAGTPQWAKDLLSGDHRGHMVDLSLLLRFSDPPTPWAVQIADTYLTAALQQPHGLDSIDPFTDTRRWRDHGGAISNLATMLAGNPDAAAHWLHQNDHLETMLLRTPRQDNIDDGTAVAALIQAGLTAPNATVAISREQDALLREDLMNRTIDTIAKAGEIGNPHLYAALADGIDANVPLFEHRVISQWDDVSEDPPAIVLTTRDFLAVVMADETASHLINATMTGYMLAGIGNAPAAALREGNPRSYRLREIGRVRGVFLDAEEHAVDNDLIVQLERQGNTADFIDSNKDRVLTGISYVAHPTIQAAGRGVGEAIVWMEGLAGKSVGQIAAPPDFGTPVQTASHDRAEAQQTAANVGSFLAFDMLINPETRDLLDDQHRATLRSAIAENVQGFKGIDLPDHLRRQLDRDVGSLGDEMFRSSAALGAQRDGEGE